MLCVSGRSRHHESRQTFTRTIHFGASCQEVAVALGAPSRIFYKSEDKMKIHNAHARKATTRSDFFFNYFTLGLVCLMIEYLYSVVDFSSGIHL